MSTTTSTTPTLLTGHCQCKKVTYTSTSLPSEMTNCYCRICSRLSGSPFLTFGAFPVSAITWTSGEDSVKKTRYSDLAVRGHCGECGSQVLMQYDCQPDWVCLTAGSFDEESVKGALPKIESHIFIGSVSKAGWYQIPDDGIPRFGKFSTGFQKRLDSWKKVSTMTGDN